ncbi:MAG: HEAT repeat domain-containing protein [Geitlerinemataceae cyanobacterium]
MMIDSTPVPTVSATENTLKIALQALTEGDFQERWEAVKLFSSLGSEAIEAAIELLKTQEDDWELCWFVARILGQSDRPIAIAALIDLLLDNENEEVKVMAATTLANFGECAIEPLTHLLAEPQWQLLAISSLAQTQHPYAIEPLLNVAKDPNPAVRAAVLEALHTFRDPRILSPLVAALEDLSATVRRQATIGLGLRCSEFPPEVDIVKLLEQRLSDLDFFICQQAAIALSRCGTEAAAQALLRVLQAPHTPVLLQVEIVRSLSWIDSLLSLEYLQQSLNLESSAVCLEAIRSIGQVSQSKSIAARILLDWLRSAHPALQQPEIRQAVALELGRLGDSQALPDLQKLKNDPDDKVRIHAETAYQKLIVDS